ncbi:heterokaryon incompatibility protein-domain-containing protein [Suillus plorans]|uniref:Heterokaryon incompatibility protein-domain-containing protein n=1 Tax=Suillus plorans TaxID=116603 RepID=A0A9P7DSE6_9AGAM|nr:heterokaryon incompatibility protein-domain-containing protein [Suillus plorans]KAG1802051.1 heterokaryon incompatibility protein-domain-containing protein [Suillus plorans]
MSMIDAENVLYNKWRPFSLFQPFLRALRPISSVWWRTMRLLHTKNLKLETPTSVRPYAILSHRWLADREEVSFQDLQHTQVSPSEGSDHAEPIFPSNIQSKQGFAKFQRACEHAFQAHLKYIWIDTCCIDKSSSAELSEAINSMYAWYRDSAVCYVYLHDVGNDEDPQFGFENAQWFKRGWTLQELLAPDHVYFFNKDWIIIGSKATFASTLYQITHIHQDILLGNRHQRESSIAEKMSWAAGRKTQRIEDRAYSLMGLFGIHMPIIYGEGDKAFKRLQLEIMKSSDDQTIFAWQDSIHSHSARDRGLLASTPDVFMGASAVVAIDYSHFINILSKSRIPVDGLSRDYSISNDGIQITLPMKEASEGWLAVLRCKGEDQEFPYGIYLKKISGSDDFLRTSPTMLEQLERKDLQHLTLRKIRILVDHHTLPTTKRRQFFTFRSTDSVWKRCGYYVCPKPGGHDVGQGGGYKVLDPKTRIELSNNMQCGCIYSQGPRGEVTVLLIGIEHHRPWVHLLADADLYRYVDTSPIRRQTLHNASLVSSPTSSQSSSQADLISPPAPPSPTSP